MNTTTELENRLEALHGRALYIRASAERDGRNLTPAEDRELTEVFGAFSVTSRELEAETELAKPQGRKTSPGAIGGAMPGEVMGGNGLSGYGAPGDSIETLDGQKLPLYRAQDRLFKGHRGDGPDAATYLRGIVTGRLDFRAQQGGQSDAAGGYLLSPTLSNEIIDIVRSRSVAVAAGCRTLVMPSRQVDFAKVVTPPVPAWRVEHEIIPEHNVVLDRASLIARNLGAMVRSSVELLDDSPAAAGLLRDQLAAEMARELDRAIFWGAGGTQPTGIASQLTVSLSAAGTVTSYLAIMDAIGALATANFAPTAIVSDGATRVNYASLPTGIAGDNTPLMAPAMVSAIPWLVTNQSPLLDSPATHEMLVGDFNRAIVGVRQQLRIEVSNSGGEYSSGSPQVPENTGDAFARNQVRIRATLRADVLLTHPLAIVRIPGIALS